MDDLDETGLVVCNFPLWLSDDIIMGSLMFWDGIQYCGICGQTVFFARFGILVVNYTGLVFCLVNLPGSFDVRQI